MSSEAGEKYGISQAYRVANVVRVRGGSVEHRHVRYEGNDPLACCEHDVADGGETWASATCGWAHSDLSPAAKAQLLSVTPLLISEMTASPASSIEAVMITNWRYPRSDGRAGRKSLTSLSSELAGIS